jgi:hypothetical protein
MATATNPLEGIQQDADGNFFDVVDLGDGSGKQVFRGKTIGEVLAQYRKAQENATRKIRELTRAQRMTATPDPAPRAQSFQPHQPSPDELWQLGEDLRGDAPRQQAALRRAMEWELGSSIAEIRQRFAEIQQDRMREQIFSAGEAFMNAHPEYVRCNENEDAIFEFLDSRGYAYTRKNFEIAFEELKPGLVLSSTEQVIPATQTETRIEQPGVVTRPRVAATGLSSRNTAVPGGGVTQMRPATKRLTLDELERMPSDEYARRMGDSQFRREADSLLEAAQRRGVRS